MSRELRFYSLVLVSALMLGAAAPQGMSQDEASQDQASQDQEKAKKEEKPKKKKGGFFGGLKAISGSSSEQQEVTATAGSKTVGEGEEIGNAKPTAADRQAVTGMEGYSIPQADLAKFQEDGQLQANQ
ncbi:MAG: hypothetical protein HYS33_02235 [Acidobacteria bacterium]|nr:hypothetical protein [Acidobacteriota bacterium]MBI1983423.1 hypothetical protein [Acidobacteriota bacterium]